MKQGQAFLALVLLIGGVIVLIGVTLSFLASSYTDTGYGYQSALSAELAANSGAQDALLKMNRFGTAVSGNYSVAVGSSTATYSVTQGSPSAGFATIVSSSTIGGRTRTVTVVVAIASSTGQATVISWQ